MKNVVKAIIVAATLAVPAASSVSAMTDTQTMAMGHAMLTGAATNALRRIEVDPVGVENLSLSEIVQLNQILGDPDSNRSTMQQNARTLLENANAN